MPTETRSSTPERAAPNAARPRGRPRLVAAGFLFAFALSVVTVILTGLWVRAPGERGGSGKWPDPPAAADAPVAESPAAPPHAEQDPQGRALPSALDAQDQ